MTDFYWLDQIQPGHRQWVGEKAFYLGLAAQRGGPVIPGFVVSAALFREFLEQVKWLDPLFTDLPNSSLHLDVDDFRQLQAIAQQIQQTIQAAPLPDRWLQSLQAAAAKLQADYLVLRPSVTLKAVTAPLLGVQTQGLFDSQICDPVADGLSLALKQSWATLFRAKSLLYWQRRGISLQRLRLAVLVQPLWAARAAGSGQIAGDHLEVHAVWGLGHGLREGDVTPDRYQINLATQTITAWQVAAQPYQYRVALPSHQQREEAIAPSSPQPSSPKVLPNLPLYRERLPAVNLNQSVLTQAQFETLTHLSRDLANELGNPLLLEWIWQDSTDGAAHPYAPFYLTQVLPQRQPAAPPSPQRQLIGGGRPPIWPNRQSVSGDRSPLILATGAAPGYALGRVQVIADERTPVPTALQPTIIVASRITPDQLVAQQQPVGIISEQGGMTSHAAIIARELGIPAVVGATQATQRLSTGDVVLLNGDRGEVYQISSLVDWFSMPTSAVPAHPAASATSPALAPDGQSTYPKPLPLPPFSSRSDTGDAAPDLPSTLREKILARLAASSVQDDRATQLMVNLSQIEAIPRIAGLGVDGVGLLRSEHMLMSVLGRVHPQQWLAAGRQQELLDILTQRVCQFAEAFAPRPVFYRSLDLRSDDAPSLMASSAAVPNPLLGLHGTLSYLHDPAMFDLELAALRRVQRAGFANVNLILPFVRSLEEVTFCQRRVGQAGLTHSANFQLWIMAEVPSVLWLLPSYIEAGIQGVSIGSNDLTQLLLATDRTLDVDAQVPGPSLHQNHPAVRQAIAHIIQQTIQANLPCSICGQAPSLYPDLIPFLISRGITSISVSPDQIAPMEMAIAQAEHHILTQALQTQPPTPPS